MLYFRVSHKDTVKVLAWLRGLFEAYLGRVLLPSSCNCWQDAVPWSSLVWGSQCIDNCRVEPTLSFLPCGPLHRAVWHGSWLCSEKASPKVKKVSDQKPQSFCNLISEMTSHQFYYILLSRGKLLDPAHTQEKRMSQRHKSQKVGPSLGFSGWESACQCRGHGFDPWSRKIPHAMEQLSPCATTTEPVL